MKNSCIIKSSKNGLHLILDDSLPFTELLQDISDKFEENRSFFGSGQMVLSISGREMDPEDYKKVLLAVEEHSNLKFQFIEDQNELTDVRMLGMMDHFYQENIYQNAKIHVGNVTSDMIVTSDSSLLILGDVKAKATVKARGNVIILGSMSGNVIAGDGSNTTDTYIVTSYLDATDATIGSLHSDIHRNESFFKRFHRINDDAVVIGAFDGQLIAEPMRSGLLNQLAERNLD